MSEEIVHAKITAKLEVLKGLREELDRRIAELERTLGEVEKPRPEPVQNDRGRATEKQVGYIYVLASRLNFRLEKKPEELSFGEARNLIDYLKKLEEKRRSGG